MYQHVSAFQEALRRDGFADCNEETQLEIAWQQAGAAQPSIQEAHKKRWLFSDMEKKSGFVLLDDALIYHTTAYTSFSECKAAMLGALALLNKDVELNFVQRVGMRYLDHFSADSLAGFGTVLHPGLVGLFNDVPGDMRHSYSETVSSVDGLILVLKSFLSSASFMLPPDLQGMTLALPEKLVRLRTPQIVLDSDCYMEKRFPFEIEVIEGHLDQLHRQLLDLFHRSLTEQGRKLWQS